LHPVRAKKHLGQHFLNDENIAFQITQGLTMRCNSLLEVGPGTGVLTKYLLKLPLEKFLALDVDTESVAFLKKEYPEHSEKFEVRDFLRINPSEYFDGCFSIIGNFPYNISSQIFFKVLDHLDQVPEVVGMLQKEVAQRIAAPPGSKVYGILSVLLQAWYDIEYLFTVDEHVFIPPPKVKSAVIRLTRNKVTDLGCDTVLFKQVVKMAFNQRRKTLRNALKSYSLKPDDRLNELLNKRAEQLSVEEFVYITKFLQDQKEKFLLEAKKNLQDTDNDIDLIEG
jgi:16S rRNA (adenine1518-N6/adenine1519-N6)-dimethyltransferase